MKITSRGWSNISFLLLGAGIAVIVFLVLRGCNEPKPDVIVNTGTDSAYYINKMGQEVAALKQREEDFYRVTSENFLDSIAKLHNTKASLIREVAILRQKGTVTITVPGKPVITTDTIQVAGNCIIPTAVAQDFVNPYYSANVFISMNGQDSSRLLLETYDTLTIVTKTVKEGGLFNRKTYLQVDAKNSNPYNHIANMQVYRKPLPKQKKIGIGPFVGYGVSGNALLKPNIVVGISVQYNIIRL